jgi:hypothetical protein
MCMEVATKAEFALARGYTVFVTPITGFARSALMARAAQLIPPPDREPYEIEIEDALEPGTKSKAEQHPEWLAKMAEVETIRWQKYIGLLLKTTVTHPEADALVNAYADLLSELRPAFEGQPAEASFVNDWVFLLMNVLAEGREIQELVKIAQGATPLTDGEFRNGLSYFRSVEVQRADVSSGRGKPVAQGVPVPERRDKRPGAKGVSGSRGSRSAVRSVPPGK